MRLGCAVLVLLLGCATLLVWPGDYAAHCVTTLLYQHCSSHHERGFSSVHTPTRNTEGLVVSNR